MTERKTGKIKEYVLKLRLTQKIVFFLSSAFIANFIACLIVFQVSYMLNSSTEMKAYAQSTAQQVEITFNQYFKNLDYTAYSIISSNWLQRLLALNYNQNTQDYQNQWDSAANFMGTLSQLNNDMAVIIYGSNGTHLSTENVKYNSQYDITEETWYPLFEQDKKYANWGEDYDFLIQDMDKTYYSFYYRITDNYHFKDLGYLIVMVPEEDIPYFSVEQNAGVVLENQDGLMKKSRTAKDYEESMGKTVEYQSDSRIYTGRYYNYAVYNRKLDSPNWTVHVITSHKKQPFFASKQSHILFLTLLFSSILIVCASLLFTKYIRNPILKCKEALLKMQSSDNWGISIKNKYYDELGDLIQGFNNMSNEIARLADENRQSEELRRVAEREMLQQQINPHFLYNTLEMISGMILEKKLKDAIAVCELLGSMFRYNLSNGSETFLEDEYRYISQYMQIAKYKIYSLEYYSEIDEELKKQRFQKFLLQPLVENAVKHGFKNKRIDCCMELDIHREQEDICISIIDNGAGMSQKTLKNIEYLFNQIKHRKEYVATGHVGIENVYRRLWLEYGDEMIFSIISREGFGTKIIIRIPVKEEKTC